VTTAAIRSLTHPEALAPRLHSPAGEVVMLFAARLASAILIAGLVLASRAVLAQANAN
jgi:hypothetical protein